VSKAFYLFPGCLIPARLPFLEASSRFVLDRLGIEHEDLPDAACCVEPIGLRTMARDTWLASAARMLAIAEGADRDIITLCNGCYMSLKEASHLLEDRAVRAGVNEVLRSIGREYRGGTKVHHLPGLLSEREAEVRASVERPMDIAVVSHPGCHMLRPSGILGIDASFRPEVLDRIASWTGANMVRSEEWPSCCGGGLSGIDEELSSKLLSDPARSHLASGASAILTPCPFCFVQFDIKQKGGLPVLYLAELLALAMGAAPEKIGMQYHRKKIIL
jgi:heterodisulfide reductase subunit B